MWTFFEARAAARPYPSYHVPPLCLPSPPPRCSAFQAELSSQMTRVATLEAELEAAKLSEGNLEQMQACHRTA
jgi:hypothetical protein